VNALQLASGAACREHLMSSTGQLHCGFFTYPGAGTGEDDHAHRPVTNRGDSLGTASFLSSLTVQPEEADGQQHPLAVD
jgi:hypothetical protein